MSKLLLTGDAEVPQSTADFETTLMTEAMYSLYLMSRDSQLPPTAVSKLLDAPPGLTKQVSCDSKDGAPPGLRPPSLSEAETCSTISCGGDGSSEHEASSEHDHHDWQGYDCTEGMPLDAFADPFASCWQRMSTPLSEDLLGLLSSRRGKQRLRALQTQSGAHAELDLQWRALHLCGTRHAILNALALLELMEGFTVKLPSALWTELLRCRNLGVDEAPMSLARIQEILGRRVHVERETFALRVFAPLAERAATAEVVQALASMCTKQTIELPVDCDWNIIKELQTSEKVTMKVEGNRVELIGLVAAVEQATKDLKKRLDSGAVETMEEAKPMLLGASLNKPKADATQWCGRDETPKMVSLVRPPPGLTHPEAQAKPSSVCGADSFKDQICYVSADNCTELCFC